MPELLHDGAAASRHVRWRIHWRIETRTPANAGFSPVSTTARRSDGGHEPGRESFSAAEGVNLDSSELEVTGDDTLGDVSDEEKGLQKGLFLLEHFTE